MMQNFAADIPPSLHEADDILTRYGRWAADFGRSARTCGSAEGNYRPGAGDALEARRDVGPLPLSMAQRVAAQRCLIRVPAPERAVLAVLYVPRRQPVGMQLRLMSVPPSMAQERHLTGLRMWWNLYRQKSY